MRNAVHTTIVFCDHDKPLEIYHPHFFEALFEAPEGCALRLHLLDHVDVRSGKFVGNSIRNEAQTQISVLINASRKEDVMRVLEDSIDVYTVNENGKFMRLFDKDRKHIDEIDYNNGVRYKWGGMGEVPPQIGNLYYNLHPSNATRPTLTIKPLVVEESLDRLIGETYAATLLPEEKILPLRHHLIAQHRACAGVPNDLTTYLLANGKASSHDTLFQIKPGQLVA